MAAVEFAAFPDAHARQYRAHPSLDGRPHDRGLPGQSHAARCGRTLPRAHMPKPAAACRRKSKDSQPQVPWRKVADIGTALRHSMTMLPTPRSGASSLMICGPCGKRSGDDRRAMTAQSPWRALLPVFAACAAIGLQAGVAMPLVPLALERQGADNLTIGIVSAGWADRHAGHRLAHSAAGVAFRRGAVHPRSRSSPARCSRSPTR